MFEGKGFSKPTIVVFLTSHPGDDSENQSSSFRNSKAFLEVLNGQKQDTNLAKAIDSSFDLYTCDVGAPNNEKGRFFKRFKYEDSPKVFVLNEEGQIVGSIGGRGKFLSGPAVYSLLNRSAKKMGFSLKERINSSG